MCLHLRASIRIYVHLRGSMCVVAHCCEVTVTSYSVDSSNHVPMHAPMHPICTSMRIYVHASMFTHVLLCASMCIHGDLCVSLCIYVHLCASMRIEVHLCASICIYVHLWGSMWVFVHT